VYLESSKDILFLVLAFCALWFTAFVCWALYYVITILRDGAHAVREIRDRIQAIDEAVRAVREKIEHSLGSFGIVATGLKMLGSYLARRKDKAVEKAREVAGDLKKRAKKMKKSFRERLEEDEPDESEEF
jgi:hypothetical protein